MLSPVTESFRPGSVSSVSMFTCLRSESVNEPARSVKVVVESIVIGSR